MKANQYIGQFLETLDSMDKNGNQIPGMIISSPGFGKTSTIAMWCDHHDYNLTTLIASNFSADDILGLQAVNNGKLERLAPSWFNKMCALANNGKRNVLFLDEIGACDSYIQAPLFNLIFNHDLAGYSLPKNTLIVAASNYSEDLNGTFKMTAPLVNRFLILNLRNEDFSIMDILDGGISDMNKKERLDFMGITKSDNKKYSFENFRNWVKDNPTEFKIGPSTFTEDNELGGLLGFISLRSFNYALKFTEAYMNTFNDNIWMRIVGDTLGISAKREGKPMRIILECNESNFFNEENISFNDSTIYNVCNSILADQELSDRKVAILENLINNASVDNITGADLDVFTKVCSRYANNHKVQYLNNIMTRKFM